MTKSLVTGGTGFIALYVVKILLEHGHHVNTTVRSLKSTAKLQPLLDLQAKFPGKLELFEADLLKNGSFRKATEGCEVVYHVASPFLVPAQIKDGIKDCVEPALQGTENVLRSVNETETVTRVVLTSSIVAMYGDNTDVLSSPTSTLTPDLWNTTSSATSNPYAFSKVVAERKAWEMCKAQSRWSMVAINPGMVIGPSLSPESASGSLYLLEAMYSGENKTGAPALHYPVADVRDVALAHVRVGEDVNTQGRYIIAGDRSVSLLDMAECVRAVHEKPGLLPTRNLPKMMLYAVGPFMGLSMGWVKRNIGVAFQVDNSRSVVELGLKYRPLQDVIRDHYKSWVELKGKK